MTAEESKPIPTEPAKRIPTAAERRAAQVALIADKQARLKQEAADRRAARVEK